MEPNGEGVAGDDKYCISPSSSALRSNKEDSERLISLEAITRSAAEPTEHANSITPALSTAFLPSFNAPESTDSCLYPKVQDLGRRRSQSSLDALDNNPPTTNRRLQPGELDRAASTALPESVSSTSSSRNCTDGDDYIFTLTNSIPDDQALKSQSMDHQGRLKQYMPHLKNVWESPRSHDRAEMECFDYTNSGFFSMQRYTFNGDLDSCQDAFAGKIVDDIPSDLKFRLLVVEDLSGRMIHILGKCLNISPEFFKEHLINSGWRDEESKMLIQIHGAHEILSKTISP